MEKYKKNRLWLIWGSVSTLVIILAVSLGFLIYGRIYSATISVMVAPSIAKVRVGEMILSSSGETKMQPGEYEVEVWADGFSTKTGRITLIGDRTINLDLYLSSNSEETADWYETHTGDAMVMGEIKNRETLKKVDELLKKEPVLAKLPLTVEYYANDYSKYTKYILSYVLDNSERGFYLIMKDYTNEGKDVGINKLTEMGMNLEGIEIKYENLGNDLKFGQGDRT